MGIFLEVFIMRYTLEERKKILNEYDSFTGSTTQFITSRNLCQATFYKWLKERNNASDVPFLDVTNKLKVDLCNDSINISVNEVKIGLSNNYNEELLLKIIRTLKKL